MTPLELVGWAVIAAMHVVGVAMLLALVRLLRGPSLPDRILALDTLFVSAIAQLVLFGMHLGTAVYFEAALVIAMLGFVGTVVLSKFVLRRDIVE
ncbi:K+/H+ antiporter subunit F [Thermomonas carbonis]|uniref:K+/H+ antiporter subunit F n=2 Tax=Thermomonas carbonis TaxID=1463158 RepID=A0A7G9SU22_9GAMM|nr:K+/H+ antiporter subunit F [Thermomonas carbonis]GHC10179.1 K+/H+ antiporter subunit F [Thermomonas carbonis]